MRRKDREVTDVQIINNILDGCKCCRIGFYDAGDIYIVPVNFGYEENNGIYTLYFHGANIGRKYDLIQRNPRVGFELDQMIEIKSSTCACSYSTEYKSIIGNGKVREVIDKKEKINALSMIMEHNTGHRTWEYDDRMLEKVSVFRIDVVHLSCKCSV